MAAGLWILFLVLVLHSPVLSSTPKWATKTPVGKHHLYAVGVGEASSLYEARRLSISDAMRVFSEQRNVTVESRFRSLTTQDKRQIEDEVSVRGASTTLKGLRLVETYESRQQSQHLVWTLMSLPSTNEISRWSTIWRSTLLPGWGQFYQGKTGRGAAFLAGTVVGVGGALYTAARQTDFEDQASGSTVPSTRHYYYDQADKYHQGNVAFVALAVVSYAINLADAIFTSANSADLYYSNVILQGNGNVTLSMTFRLRS